MIELNYLAFYINYVTSNLDKTNAKKILDQIDWKTWIYGPGLPPITIDLDTEVYHEAIDIAHHYMNS